MRKKRINEQKRGFSPKRRSLGKNRGLPPGTLVPNGNGDNPAAIHMITYNMEAYTESPLQRGEVNAGEKESVTWLNIIGPYDSELLRQLGDRFGFSRLTLEDIQNTEHRPKFENNSGYLFIILRMLTWDESANRIRTEQVSLLLGENCVISIQERPGDVFDPIRQRIRENRGRLRQQGADYLLYALMDAIVDNYFPVCDRIRAGQEKWEADPEAIHSAAIFQEILSLKKEQILVRKAVWPLREVLLELLKEDSGFIKEENRDYFSDIHDHLLLITDLVDQLREVLAGFQDSLMSAVSFEMNSIMKVLTIIATIFIPLTFLAGIYGMNFVNMPELQHPNGYYMVLAGMGVIFIGMVIFFKRKKWF